MGSGWISHREIPPIVCRLKVAWSGCVQSAGGLGLEVWHRTMRYLPRYISPGSRLGFCGRNTKRGLYVRHSEYGKRIIGTLTEKYEHWSMRGLATIKKNKQYIVQLNISVLPESQVLVKKYLPQTLVHAHMQRTEVGPSIHSTQTGFVKSKRRSAIA